MAEALVRGGGTVQVRVVAAETSSYNLFRGAWRGEKERETDQRMKKSYFPHARMQACMHALIRGGEDGNTVNTILYTVEYRLNGPSRNGNPAIMEELWNAQTFSL